jgi:retinol dehydrogenase 12
MTPPLKMVTKQGVDLQFGVNVIGTYSICVTRGRPAHSSAGHAYFTKLLLPTLLETAKTAPDGKVRVINTSSK